MSATVVNIRSAQWGEFVNKQKYASLFSSPGWIEALNRTYGFEIMVSIVSHDDSASGVLFSTITDLRGERMVSLPFSDYCDPLVSDPRVWHELIEPLLTSGNPIRLRCLHNDLPINDSRFFVRKTAKWHAIELSRTEDELWNGLSGSARQNIRYARRSGVRVRIGKTMEDMFIFHRMHAQLRKRKYRLLAQPRLFFENLHQIFLMDDYSAVLLAELDGIPLAGILLLNWGTTAYYKFNASLDQRCRPNDLLMWHAMLFGQQNGLKKLDLGLSDSEQTGLTRYKEKFSTEERTISFVERASSLNRALSEQDASKVLADMSQMLTNPAVPDEITWEAGDKLYRLFA
jgi:CelD/BcsL family acetyltransferase involved in cellulose biosynthesis